MALDDKIQNAAEKATGKAKEATDDDELQAEGQADQTKAQAKKIGEDVKDVFK